MKSSDQLFQLIKSLSKGEKRNVKLYAKLQDGDKNYLTLFDAIDRQEVYDEAAVMAEFEGERLLKQFSVAKNYLYNFILKTLDLFGKDSQAELCAQIHQAQILIQKGLYDQAHKLVRRARYDAERRERFQELLHLYQCEREILKRSNQVREFEAFIGEIGERERQVLAQQQNLLEYTHLQDRIQMVMRKSGSARTQEDLDQMREFADHPLLKDASAAISQRALIRHYNIAAEYYWFVSDIPKALESTEASLKSYEANDNILQEENGKYIGRLANLGVLQFKVGRKQEMLETLEKLKNVSTYNRNEVLQVFERYYLFKLIYHFEHARDLELARSIALETEEKLEKYERNIQKSLVFEFYFQLANFHTVIGDYRKALAHINKVLNEPKSEVREDIQCAARVMNIIIHFELGNHELLDSLIQSAYRFIVKRNRLYPYDREVLKFFSHWMKTKDSSSTAFMELERRLVAVEKEGKVERTMTLFNTEQWVRSRIRNVSMYTLRGIEKGEAETFSELDFQKTRR